MFLDSSIGWMSYIDIDVKKKMFKRFPNVAWPSGLRCQILTILIVNILNLVIVLLNLEF